MELWKDIEGLEGLYQVSNKGNFKSLDRAVRQRNESIQIKKGMVRKQTLTPKGYLFVSLSKQNINLGGLSHRFVAKAFIPNPENKPQVNHIDGVKTNNNVENLEWVTNQENVEHAKKMGLMVYRPENLRKATISAAEANKIKVKRICKTSGETTIYNSIIEAGKDNNNKQKGISETLNGRQKSAAGYNWERVN